jgi:hypothetical protein
MDSVNLIFIGDRFYSESGTVMSSLYTKDGTRYDWGFVNRDLRSGRTVNIRPATAAELRSAERNLAQIVAAKSS